MLGGELAVLQAPMFDGLSLDPFAQFDDCRSPAEVGVGRRHVGQALVVSLVIVQQGLGTPTEPSSARFSIGIIRGLAVRSAFMASWRSATACISAAR